MNIHRGHGTVAKKPHLSVYMENINMLCTTVVKFLMCISQTNSICTYSQNTRSNLKNHHVIITYKGAKTPQHYTTIPVHETTRSMVSVHLHRRTMNYSHRTKTQKDPTKPRIQLQISHMGTQIHQTNSLRTLTM